MLGQSDQTGKKWPIFLVVATGVFMSTLDSSMVNIALPAIMLEFHSSLHNTKWVVMIYLLAITASLLFWGHLGDRLGRRRIYSLGMLIFGTGSLFCGISPRIAWLITFRFGQAVGAAMMMSSGPALIKEFFPTIHLGRNLGLIGMAVSLGLMTGPSLGGFLIEYLSWRSIFLVTAPLGLLFFLLARRVLPDSPAVKNHEKFDITGSMAWAVSVSVMALTIANPPDVCTSPLFLVLLGLGTFIFYLFLKHENSVPNPLFPLYLFKKRFFGIAVICVLLSFSILFSVTLLIPFYLDRVLGLSASRIGMIMLAIPISVLVVAPTSGWLSDRVGARYITTFGLLTSTSSLFLLAGLNSEATVLEVAVRLAFLGCGQAMFLAPNSASVLAHVKNDHAGVSAGLLATARNFGMLLGVAQAGMIFSFFYGKHTGGLDLKDFDPTQTHSFMMALKASFLAAGSMGMVGVILSWMRGPGLRRAGRN